MPTMQQESAHKPSEPSFGSWGWDAVSQRFLWDERSRDMLGLEKDTYYSSLDSFVNLVNRRDQRRVWKEFSNALRNSESFSFRFRIVTPAGETNHLHMLGSVFLDSSGRAAEFGGFCLKMCSDEAHAVDRAANNKQPVLNIDNTANVAASALSARMSPLAGDLCGAARRDEFRLEFQPVIDLFSGRVTSVEALIRWHHPKRGLIAPDEFIPVAEGLGLSGDIGRWVLAQACSQAKEWESQSLPRTPIAINVSAEEISTLDFVSRVADELAKHRLDARWLMIEVTESMMMHHVKKAQIVISKLQSMGVLVAIDDFGTGYSSLSNIKNFSVDYLKLDGSFVGGLPDGAAEVAISRTVIAIAKSLEMRVVAEGVQTEAQLDFLKSSGCAEAQGFYLCKPQPAEQLTKTLFNDYADIFPDPDPTVTCRTLNLDEHRPDQDGIPTLSGSRVFK